MASEETKPLPPAAARQNNFEQGVAFALHLWPALTLSVSNNWGGPDSSEKRDWFAGAVVDLFSEFTDTPSTSTSTALEPDLHDVETVILQVMVDEFEVNVDDDSGAEVAGQIIKCRAQCAAGVWDEVEHLRERFKNKGGKKVDAQFKKIEADDQDTDWESDDEVSGGDEDEEMGDAPAPAREPREKPQPEIDEDGFQKVTRKR